MSVIVKSLIKDWIAETDDLSNISAYYNKSHLSNNVFKNDDVLKMYTDKFFE